jgi:septal ring factor EnvC (AmiA/AmiB activator)
MSESRRRDSTGRYKTQDQAIKDLVAKGEKELAEKREARAKARAIRMQKLREEEVSWDAVVVGYH